MVEDIDRAVEAIGKIKQISRARCRREFEQRFTDRHMAEDYIRIYQQLLSRSSTQVAAKSCFRRSRRSPISLKVPGSCPPGVYL